MSNDSFSGSNPAQRVAALLDPGSFIRSLADAQGSVIAGSGLIGGREVSIAATDRETAGGSLGVIESHAISALLTQSESSSRPLILCLDSAGARLDEGLPALGAFRQLYRHLLDLRIAGVPALALIGRDCFGGASMLAATCSRRVYCENSRLAMSGPAVIQALGGKDELEASNADAVTALMGGAARVRLRPADRFSDDTLDDYRQAALEWVARCDADGPVNFREQHNQLGIRLLAHDMALSPPSTSVPDLPGILRELVPPGFESHEMDGVLIGRAGKESPNAFFGFLGGVPVGARAAWTLAGECLALVDTNPGVAVTVLLDSPGQAPTSRDERVMLSEYVTHLALVLTQLRKLGHRLTLQVLGDAAGGIYVALAAPASRVVALPGANVQMLPPAAIARVLGRHNDPGDVDDYLRAGVIDTLI